MTSRLAAKRPPLVPMRPSGPLPVSLTQQGLWLHSQLYPAGNAYNMHWAFRLTGPLNVDALSLAFGALAHRHQALRTTFEGQEGAVVQVVAPASPELLTVVGPMPGDAEAEALRRAETEARRPFDLQCGPLFRATLLKVRPDEHILVIVVHHIIFDGWSSRVVFRELSTLYRAFVKGDPSPLNEARLQYGDYTLWRRSWLCDSVLEAQLAYWRSTLAEAPTVLELPTDRPRGDTTSPAGRCHFELEAPLATALTTLGKKEGATLTMVLLGAFGALLGHLAGQSEVIIGCPVSNRADTASEGLVGLLINTLPLKVDLRGDPTGRELVTRVRATSLEAYEHGDVPFESIVHALRLKRVRGRTPLVQVLFSMLNLRGGAKSTLDLEGVSVGQVPLAPVEPMFDIVLIAQRRDACVPCDMAYDSRLFDAATIERVAAQLRVLLEAIATGPDRHLHELPMGSARASRVQKLTEKTDRELSQKTSHHVASREFVAPRTPDEEVIADVWRKALRLERVGVHDDFFELGGHSLLAIQVVARLQDAFDVDLSLGVVFEATTVEELAETILQLQLSALPDETRAKLLG